MAHLARFIIADITEPRSIPQELEAIVPHLASVPIQPLLQGSSTECGMFGDFSNYPWVLDIHRYKNEGELLKSIAEKVIGPEAKRVELLKNEPLCPS